MKTVIDIEIIKEMLKFIKDKDAFILDLAKAINKAYQESNPTVIEECISDWEDIAELNSIPGFSKNVALSYKALVDKGIINGK